MANFMFWCRLLRARHQVKNYWPSSVNNFFWWSDRKGFWWLLWVKNTTGGSEHCSWHFFFFVNFYNNIYAIIPQRTHSVNFNKWKLWKWKSRRKLSKNQFLEVAMCFEGVIFLEKLELDSTWERLTYLLFYQLLLLTLFGIAI